MVSMTFDENWITFTLRYVVEYKSRRGTKDAISRRILSLINNSEERINVASAASEVTLFTGAKLKTS